MISKKLERKIILDKNESVYSKVDIELEYYLTEAILGKIDNHNKNVVYGVEILKKENDLLIENKLINDISTNREEIENLVHKMADNLVTPMGLPYILDDMIGV